jgi:hypothetical protein
VDPGELDGPGRRAAVNRNAVKGESMAKKKAVKKTTTKKSTARKAAPDPELLSKVLDTAVGLKRQERSLHMVLYITLLGAQCIFLACYALTVTGAPPVAGVLALFGIVFCYYWYLHSNSAGLRVGYWEETCRSANRELVEALDGGPDLFHDYKGVEEERIVKITGDEGQPIDSAVQSVNSVLKAVPFVFGGLWIFLVIISLYYWTRQV